MDKGSELAESKECIKQGEKEGLIEGEKKGIEKGAQQKMKELVINMKNQGLDDNFIAKCSNISIDE